MLIDKSSSATRSYEARFVVLFHQFPIDHPRNNHWDLMLETPDTLTTYALNELPAIGKTIPAYRLPDHRKHYLEYEGPISNNRGSVRRVMQGIYAWTTETLADKTRTAVLIFEEQQWQMEFTEPRDEMAPTTSSTPLHIRFSKLKIGF